MIDKDLPIQKTGVPFIKWVGGKRKLLPVIEQNLPQNFKEIKRVVEPFTGGGSFFLIDD